MGWFLWGVLLGWGACTVYHYSQSENDKVGNGAAIIAMLILMVATVISINLGIASGGIKADPPTPTPTYQGR